MFKLYDAFMVIDSEKEFNNFLYDLLTITEIKNLRDRFKVAQLLQQGNLTQREVAKKCNCSITTVTRVARFLNNEKYGGYKTILKKLENNKKSTKQIVH